MLAVEATETAHAEAPPRRGKVVTALRGLAVLLLGGLTSMEVLALCIGFVSVVGLLWTTHTVPPERLLTEPTLRVAWVLAVVAVVRPLTWVPYVLLFVGLRALMRRVSPQGRPWVRNLVSNLLTLALLAVAAALVFLAVPGSVRWTQSALGFAMGTVDFDRLGTATGTWDAARVAVGVGAFVLLRPVVPPLSLGLDLAVRPILGFVRGARGTVDKVFLAVTAVFGIGVAVLEAIRR